MIQCPPRSTPTYTCFPYATIFGSFPRSARAAPPPAAPPAPSAVRTWLFLTSDRHQIADPRIILNQAHAQHTPAPPQAAVEHKPSAPPSSHCPAPVPAPRVPPPFAAAPARHARTTAHRPLRPRRPAPPH